MFVITEAEWFLYVLTAGTALEDEDNVLPVDYHATTNAKHWHLSMQGYVLNNALVTEDGSPLVDSNGNTIVYQ